MCRHNSGLGLWCMADVFAKAPTQAAPRSAPGLLPHQPHLHGGRAIHARALGQRRILLNVNLHIVHLRGWPAGQGAC